MEKTKTPAFNFYSSDFLTGVRLMSYEEIGKYITLLCLQHQQGHLTEEDMVSICGDYIPRIYNKFLKDEEGKYYNDRLEIETIKRAKYTESRRENRAKKTYVKHMENENVNENINIFINNNNYTNELYETIIAWLDYKLQRNENYQEQGFKSLLTQIKNNTETYGEEKVIEIINSSMSSMYKGIIWDKLKKSQSTTKPFQTNFDKSQEALRKAREGLADE